MRCRDWRSGLSCRSRFWHHRRGRARRSHGRRRDQRDSGCRTGRRRRCDRRPDGRGTGGLGGGSGLHRWLGGRGGGCRRARRGDRVEQALQQLLARLGRKGDAHRALGRRRRGGDRARFCLGSGCPGILSRCAASEHSGRERGDCEPHGSPQGASERACSFRPFPQACQGEVLFRYEATNGSYLILCQ